MYAFSTDFHAAVVAECKEFYCGFSTCSKAACGLCNGEHGVLVINELKFVDLCSWGNMSAEFIFNCSITR